MINKLIDHIYYQVNDQIRDVMWYQLWNHLENQVDDYLARRSVVLHMIVPIREQNQLIKNAIKNTVRNQVVVKIPQNPVKIRESEKI